MLSWYASYKSFKYMQRNSISYIWVSNRDGTSTIPSTESSHGIQNIINTANRNPTRTINVYVDNIRHRSALNIELLPHQAIPRNVQFVAANELLSECKKLAVRNKHDTKIFDDIYGLYLGEMKYGKPVFAANCVKFLALYKGGVVSDIGVPYNRAQFHNLIKEVPLFKREGKYGFPIFQIDDRFHVATPPVLFYANPKRHSRSVYNALRATVTRYNNPNVEQEMLRLMNNRYYQDYLRFNQIDPDEIICRIKKYYRDYNPSMAFIRSATDILDCHGAARFTDILDNKYQDYAYGLASSHGRTMEKALPEPNHKLSHCGYGGDVARQAMQYRKNENRTLELRSFATQETTISKGLHRPTTALTSHRVYTRPVSADHVNTKTGNQGLTPVG